MLSAVPINRKELNFITDPAVVWMKGIEGITDNVSMSNKVKISSIGMNAVNVHRGLLMQ